VIADRYWYSTLAYQSAGDGLDSETVLTLCRLATGGLAADLIVYLDVPPEVGLERTQRGTPDVLDRRPLDFHARVRRRYQEMAAEDPARWRVFDGTKQSDVLAREIRGNVLGVCDVVSATAR
jgi:dTMP kinase